MIISDLSYLNEIAEESIHGATNNGKDFSFSLDKEVEVDFDIHVDSRVNAHGAVNEAYLDLTGVGAQGSGTESFSKQLAMKEDGKYISHQTTLGKSWAK